jgi:hypothetical protein
MITGAVVYGLVSLVLSSRVYGGDDARPRLTRSQRHSLPTSPAASVREDVTTFSAAETYERMQGTGARRRRRVEVRRRLADVVRRP